SHLRAHLRRQGLRDAAGCAAHDPGPLVRHERAEDRVPDRLPDLHPVRDHRPGGCERADVDGHDDALAGADLAAVQADAVRAGGRLESGDGHVGCELLLMTPEMVMTIGQRALEITILLAAPLLLAALIIGLLVGVFQAATQINEMTLSFIPKLVGMAGT